ncbi:MAG: hypothetical protein IJF74_08160 [Clostridia bacterium]|nr:hypothetical protein [Clostridia bacterium]
MLNNPTSVAFDPYKKRFDMPQTREELLSELDMLDERLSEIAEEIDSLSADWRRLSGDLDTVRDTLLALNGSF